MRPNSSKNLALQGKPALGTMCNAASPLIAEWLGHSGYDFVVVDLQHGENNLDNLSMMLQALSSTPATPVVRVPANVPMYIQRALDRSTGEHCGRSAGGGGQRALCPEGHTQLGAGARRDLRWPGLLFTVSRPTPDAGDARVGTGVE